MIKDKVVVFEFGEPVIKTVINVNHETRQIKLQTEGSFGSYWLDMDKTLSQYQIDYHFICKADSEVKRLQIKSSMLNGK